MLLTQVWVLDFSRPLCRDEGGGVEWWGVFSIAFHYSWPPGPGVGRTRGANINSYSCKLGARHPRNPKNICSGERERQITASQQLVVQSEESLFCFFLVSVLEKVVPAQSLQFGWKSNQRAGGEGRNAPSKPAGVENSCRSSTGVFFSMYLLVYLFLATKTKRLAA